MIQISEMSGPPCLSTHLFCSSVHSVLVEVGISVCSIKHVGGRYSVVRWSALSIEMFRLLLRFPRLRLA